MKIRTQCEISVPGEVLIEDVQIAGKKYVLRLSQMLSNDLQISFEESTTKAMYRICIDGRGLRLERDVVRPNHDHGDSEDMRIVNGKPAWFHGHINDALKHKLAWFEFGARTVDW